MKSIKLIAIVAIFLLFAATQAIPGTSIYHGTDRSIGTDYPHHELHVGNSYCSGFNNTLASGGKSIFLINTPAGDVYAHMIIMLRSSGESYYEVWEDATVSAVGTAMEENNHNRNSSNTSSLEITRYPTIADAGTIVTGLTQHVGNGQVTGGSSDRGGEIVLKANTLYIINAVSEANGNDVTVTFDWYLSGDYY